MSNTQEKGMVLSVSKFKTKKECVLNFGARALVAGCSTTGASLVSLVVDKNPKTYTRQRRSVDF